MITTTVTVDDFRQWLKTSDSYKDYFSYEGAGALFEYLEDLSEQLDENFDYDPIAWCCEYSEYKDLKEACKQYDEEVYFSEGQALEDYTEVITFDNGIIVKNF